MSQRAERVFLGWDGPVLANASRELCRRAATAQGIHLGEHYVVTPGARAGRLLLSALVAHAESIGTPLSPPTLLTPGEIADALLQPAKRPAGPMMRRFAWIMALRQAPSEQLRDLAPSPPDDDDLRAWSALAGLLRRSHDELANELILFDEAPERAGGLSVFSEDRRWRAAGRIQRAMRAILLQRGLVDPSLEQLEAIREERPIVARPIVLVGVAELSAAARTCLERAGERVVAMIAAPEDMAERFDGLGCVVTEQWESAPIPLDPGQIYFEDSPSDQAERMLEVVAREASELAPDEIVIGAADDAVALFIERKAEQAGVQTRWAAGAPVSQSPPYRLLALIAEYLDRRDFDALTSLVRHPDCERWIATHAAAQDARALPAYWLDALDSYQERHFHREVTGVWRTSRDRDRDALDAVHQALTHLLEGLLPPDAADESSVKPVSQWVAPILDALRRIYGGSPMRRTAPAQRRVIDACLLLRDILKDFAAPVAADGHADELSATASQAIELALEQASLAVTPQDPDSKAVEMLGWLELGLDPSPVVVITGMNEGKAPASVVGDALMPDTLRAALGVTDNRRRLARDVYLLSLVLSSKKKVTLISGRIDADNNPIQPSRLLFHCDDAQVVKLLRRFTGDEPNAAPRVRPTSVIAPGDVDRFLDSAMETIIHEPVTSMSVTSFKRYIASPFAFYLERVLRLKVRGDRAVELDPLKYGSLVHEALEKFGKSDASRAEDEDRIRECLLDTIGDLGRKKYGDHPPAAVSLQLELARRQLMAFASWQANRMHDGWRIEHVEWKPTGGEAPFIVDGQPMGLRGKIDRIDRRESDGKCAIIDYKTSKASSDPRKAMKRSQWVDLQLPLYRRLVAELELPDELELGYVDVSQTLDKFTFNAAQWTDDELALADETARDVIRSVRRGEFRSVGELPSLRRGAKRGHDALMAMCGVGLLGRSAPSKLQEESEEA